MQLVNQDTRVRALADVAGGEQVQVVEIVFDSVRLWCPVIGLHPGDILDCEERTPRSIALRRRDGTRVVIDPFYASFIAIRSHVGRNAEPHDREPSGGRTPT
jgi:hypothetical protein